MITNVQYIQAQRTAYASTDAHLDSPKIEQKSNNIKQENLKQLNLTKQLTII